MAGVLRGVISQRLLPRASGGRMPAVEVMVVNARIEDLIREGKTEEISEAIEAGEFFSMQTFTKALLDLVLAGELDRDVAANAATNRHDFLIALERALKEQEVEAQAKAEEDAEADPEPEDESSEPSQSAEEPEVEHKRPALRIAARNP